MFPFKHFHVFVGYTLESSNYHYKEHGLLRETGNVFQGEELAGERG
jgi:hypothetical protein